MLILYYRVESIYQAIKAYLGSKKTRRNLLTTWLYIEAAIVDQISTIETGDSSDRDCILIELNWVFFCRVFGIVTWYIYCKVLEYYNTTIKLYKLYTSIFTKATGLLCIYVYNNRQNTTRFLPADFYIYWFWDRGETRVPYRDPVLY
jgi:hypothetical protein